MLLKKHKEIVLSNNHLYCQVITANATLDYICPEHLVKHVFRGRRIIVPLRDSNVIGLIYKISDSTAVPQDKLRHITSILEDKFPLVLESTWRIVNWLVSYYCIPLHKAIKMVVPRWFFTKSSILIFEKPDFFLLASKINCDDIKIQQAYSSLSGYEGELIPSKELYAKLDNNIILIFNLIDKGYLSLLHTNK